MGKLNHQKIANTKDGVVSILRKLEKRTDSFVDSIVQIKPDVFEGEDSDLVIDPFKILTLMVIDLEKQFYDFKKEMFPNGVPEMKENNTDNVSELKKKTDTTH